MTAVSAPRVSTRDVVKYVILGLFALPWVVLPLWFLVVNSFKSQEEASRPSIGLPTHWQAIENYTTVLFEGDYLVGLKNSLIVVIPVVAAVLVLGAMAAWVFARSSSMTFRVFYYVLSLSVILPPAIVPTVVMITKAGLTGSLLGYILALVGTRVGIIVFLTTGYVRTLPTDFEEAAQLDGANRWQMFWRVVLPLLAPVLFTAAVMTVINVWNDFFFALYMTKGAANATIPLTLYSFANDGIYGLRWNLVFAQVVLSALPLLVAYVLMQRRILSGLTDGGVTG